MDDDYTENNNEIIGSSENVFNNNQKNQNSSLDQNSTSANNTNGLQNKNLKFDEIPIKPAVNNFLELLEKNLKNTDAIDDYENEEDNFNRPKIQYEPRKKREIKFDFSKQKKYKYYAEKFDKNFGKDAEGFGNHENYGESNFNNKKNKGASKYDKMKSHSSSNAVKDAFKSNNVKKDNSISGIRNSNVNANSAGNNNNLTNKNKGNYNFIRILFIKIDMLSLIYLSF